MMRCAWMLLMPAVLVAQTAPPAAPSRPWSNVTTLSYVATSGNATSQAFGFKNDYGYTWDLSTFTLKAGAIRAESTTVTRAAVGTSLANAQVYELRTTTISAESYFLNGRFDQRFKGHDRWYWYGAAGWERNRPAGLENRYSAGGGAGRILIDTEATKWKMDAGLGMTREDPIIAPPDFKHSFGTFNFTSALKHNFNAAVAYAADLSLVDNLNESKDWIGVLKQGVTAAMTKQLALKVGVDLNYRNRPNLLGVDVYTPAVPPVLLGKTLIPAKKLDTVFTTSLVITF